ncbi:MAG: HD domain-containing protein [Chloroflexi bacterium]|nr:HD domain-containing protein [Chloroflexota bacterium]
MTQANFEGARQYALRRLQQELLPKFVYHSLWHTQDEVLPASEQLAALEAVAADDLLLLRTAALFHDVGFTVRRAGHEEAGRQIAAEVLPGFGYHPSQIAVIGGIIIATKLPQSPHTRLEEIIADADLDVLGREDFMLRNQVLREELAAFGSITTDRQWLSTQLKFLKNHHYFTAAARSLRDGQKKKNVEALNQLLACLPG